MNAQKFLRAPTFALAPLCAAAFVLGCSSAAGTGGSGGEGGAGVTNVTHATNGVTTGNATSGNGTTGGFTTATTTVTSSATTAETTSATTTSASTTTAASTSASTSAATTTAATTAASTSAATTAAATTAAATSSSTGAGPVSCVSATECGDTATHVCDPATQTCGPIQCSTTIACDASHTCLLEVPNVTVGACFPSCTAFGTNTCGTNHFCESISAGTTSGACLETGTAAVNTTCTQTGTTTGCATGSVCLDDGLANPICRKECDFFNSPAGCGGGLHCVLGNVCTSSNSDPAALSGNCAAAAQPGDYCGTSASSYAGACEDVGNPTLECLKLCRVAGNDCTAPQICQAVLSDPSVGVCF